MQCGALDERGKKSKSEFEQLQRLRNVLYTAAEACSAMASTLLRR